MSNPFIIPGSPFTEVQRKQRERFKIGVYAALTTTAVFCFAMLIQGCRREVPQNSATQADAITPPAAETTAAGSPAAQPADPAAPATTTPEVAAVAPANQGGVTSPAPVAVTAPAADQAVTAAAVQPEPAKVEAAPAPASVESTYVVKPGDTLIRIARTHSTTVQALKAANGLRTDRIVAGKQLKIPAGRKSTAGSVQG